MFFNINRKRILQGKTVNLQCCNEIQEMKKYIFHTFLLSATFCLAAQAQETIKLGPLHSAESMRENWLLPGDTIVQNGKLLIYNGKPIENKDYTLSSHTLTEKKPLFSRPCSDFSYGNGLHKGLNVSVGLSAFATFGKGLPHHGGFGQNINLTYLSKLTCDGKAWMAVGGYLNNTFWGSDSYRDAGLYAILGYRFNEHWEAYAYGQLSLCNNYSSLYNAYNNHYYGFGSPFYAMAFPLTGVMPGGYGMGAEGANVIGAGVKYNVNKNFAIGINVEGVFYNNKAPYYFDQYNYPVPTLER